MSGVTSSTVAILILLALALGAFASPLFIVPIVLLALLIAGLGPVLRFVAERGDLGTAEPTGVPTTREASYDPVSDPASRS